MNTKLFATLLLATPLLFGCAVRKDYTDAPVTFGGLYPKTAVLGYEGEPMPIEDAGIVTTDGVLYLTSLDGKPIHTYKTLKTKSLYKIEMGRYQLHLTPGEHVLTMGFSSSTGGGPTPTYRAWSKADVTKTITIAKGQVIHLNPGWSNGKWNAFTHDGSRALPVIKADFLELAAQEQPEPATTNQ